MYYFAMWQWTAAACWQAWWEAFAPPSEEERKTPRTMAKVRAANDDDIESSA